MARGTTVKKKSRKTTLGKLANNITIKAARLDEPTFTDTLTQLDMLKAYQWYSAYYDLETGHKFILEYLKSVGFPKDKIALIQKTDKKDLVRVGTSAGWNARIMKLGGKLPDDVAKNFGKKVHELVALGKEYSKPSENVTKTVRDYVALQVGSIMADIDDALDKFTRSNDATFDISEYLKKRDIKSGVAGIVSNKLKPLYNEIALAFNGKEDDLVEAYAFMSRRNLKKYAEFLKNMISVLEGVKATPTPPKPRKQRVKKVKPVSEIVAKVKYAREFGKFKSEEPAKIIGASQVWVYNTKYKKVGVYNAMSVSGLGIKGTTIQGFDTATSICKTLRKPEEKLNELMTSGKVSLRTYMSKINSVETALTGRLNSDTVIIRIVK